jgi:hypothetical protein
VLGALLTVEWVATAEAVKVLAIGRLLAASSCTDGEKVVRAVASFRVKCGDMGKAAARRPYRWRSGARPGDKARSDSGDSSTISDSRGGAASDSGGGIVWQPLSTSAWHRGSPVGVARCMAPGGDSALTSGPGVEREKLTGGTSR